MPAFKVLPGESTGGSEARSADRPPLVLLVNDQEWSARSLESILGPQGFAVLRAYTGRRAFERLAAAQPDLIVVDESLPDISGLDFCRRVRFSASPGTPIVMTAASRPPRAMRIEALEAGAWDLISHPFDAEELVLRLSAYVRGKLYADELQRESLVDEATGLYNTRGLSRRAAELGSHAYRHSTPLACVAFTIGGSTDGEDVETTLMEVVSKAAMALKTAGRNSDAIGRLGRSEFAIIAPATDEDGARRLAERLAGAIQEARPGGQFGGEWTLRAGYDSVANFREASVQPTDLLMRASNVSRNDPQSIIPLAASVNHYTN